jgi:hypothetical protein
MKPPALSSRENGDIALREPIQFTAFAAIEFLIVDGRGSGIVARQFR